MIPTPIASPAGAAKIFLYSKDVDMRKSFDGLHAIVQEEFQRDVRAGDLFLFLNRRLDRIKLLHWDGDGMTIWMKRLEAGRYQCPRISPDAMHVEMDATDLAILLTGIDLASLDPTLPHVPNRPKTSSKPVLVRPNYHRWP